jgi:mevalonate kinase
MAGSSLPLHTNGLNGQNGARPGTAGTSPPRRGSSPLMPPFMVSAPGKVIVYGEHAVVHGKVGWSCAVSCTVEPTDAPRLQLPLPSPCDPISS